MWGREGARWGANRNAFAQTKEYVLRAVSTPSSALSSRTSKNTVTSNYFYEEKENFLLQNWLQWNHLIGIQQKNTPCDRNRPIDNSTSSMSFFNMRLETVRCLAGNHVTILDRDYTLPNIKVRRSRDKERDKVYYRDRTRVESIHGNTDSRKFCGNIVILPLFQIVKFGFSLSLESCNFEKRNDK